MRTSSNDADNAEPRRPGTPGLGFSRPVACLTVPQGECLAALPDQVAVDVRGWPEIGRAVVVAVNGTEFWPSWPCTTVRSPPKLTAPAEQHAIGD